MADLKAEQLAACDYVDDLVNRGKYDFPAENACGWGYLWHGYALRDAFEAGVKYGRAHPSPDAASSQE